MAQHSLKEAEWSRRIRLAMSGSSYIRGLFDKFSVPFNNIKYLNVHIDNLNGKLAEIKDGDMWLDLSLFRQDDFMNSWLHVVAQHLPKWLASRSVWNADMAQDEGYVTAMAYSLSNGITDIFSLEQKFLPLIRLGCKDYTEADKQFVLCLKLARIELAKSKKGNK